MKIQVRMFGRFKQLYGEKKEVQVPEGAHPLDALGQIVARESELCSAIYDGDGRIRNHIILMVNRKRISPPEFNLVELQEDDELAVLPPVAGG